MADEKKKRQPDTNGNNDLSEFMDEMRENFNILTSRQDELEDLLKELGRGVGEEKVILAKKLYDTNKREIMEVSRIDNESVGSFALAYAVGAYLSPEIQNGEITLPLLVLDNFMRLKLSAHGGWNRGLTVINKVIQEQFSSEGREAQLGEEIPAGGG